MRNRTGSRPRPIGGVERFLWLYVRLSAVALLGLVVGHLYIMHVINSTDTLSFAFVARRFTGPFWRVYDALILLFALSHGLVGMRGMLRDYIHRRGWRLAAEAALWAVGAAFLLLGGLVLVAFR